jgi:hypothetical protein
MTKVRIEANIDADSGWVELDPPQARVPKGATVIWAFTFTAVPDDLRPALLFESFIPESNVSAGLADPILGPFRELSRRGSKIHGSGFEGLAGQYIYKICLVAKDGSNPLVRKLRCRNVPAGGLVPDPGTRGSK